MSNLSTVTYDVGYSLGVFTVRHINNLERSPYNKIQETELNFIDFGFNYSREELRARGRDGALEVSTFTGTVGLRF